MFSFNSLRKLSLLTLGSLKLSGNEFQANGPAAEKARQAVRSQPVTRKDQESSTSGSKYHVQLVRDSLGHVEPVQFGAQYPRQ